MATTGKQTRVDQVYAQLHADILTARLKPGQRLKFAEICARYDTSVGVAREALSRLSAERIVVPRAHQGFSVVDVSIHDLADLSATREEVESRVFELAVQHGDADWEANVVAAHHRLSIAPTTPDGSDPAATEKWSNVHEQFHRALLAACPYQRLRELAEALREEGIIYRLWAGPLGSGDRDLAAEHAALAQAVVDRNSTLAKKLLRAHISLTTEILTNGLRDATTANQPPATPAPPTPRRMQVRSDYP